MTLHIDTPTTFREMRSNTTDAPHYPGTCGVLFTGVMVAMVSLIVLVGWLAFSEITRCDPCEWVQFDAPMEGW
jgi:hypothetical protein